MRACVSTLVRCLSGGMLERSPKVGPALEEVQGSFMGGVGLRMPWECPVSALQDSLRDQRSALLNGRPDVMRGAVLLGWRLHRTCRTVS